MSKQGAYTSTPTSSNHTHTMEEVITIKQQAKTLKKQGLTIREIADKLNISKSSVGRMLSQAVPDIVPSVPECPTHEQTESVADLKTKLNTLLKDIYKRLIDIEKEQSTMQEEFNTRLNKFLNNALNNRLESLQEHIMRRCMEELRK